MNVFLIEAPSPVDKAQNRSEIESLESLGCMFGHSVASFDIYSDNELKSIIEYISTIEVDEGTGKIKDNIIVHLSCHGNSKVIQIGKDPVSWSKLASYLVPLSEDKFANKTLLCISSCGTSEQQFTSAFNALEESIKSKISPPSFVVFFDQDTVFWDDSLISWSMFYHQLGKLGNSDFTKEKLILVIDLIRKTEISELAYSRWDQKKLKYHRYSPETK